MISTGTATVKLGKHGLLEPKVAFTRYLDLSPHPWSSSLFPQTALTMTVPFPLPLGLTVTHYLDKHLAQERHDEGWVHATEPAHGADGQLPDLKHLVVQGHKQGLQILCLGQVCIKALIQGCQDTVADVRVCKSNYAFERLFNAISPVVFSQFLSPLPPA